MEKVKSQPRILLRGFYIAIIIYLIYLVKFRFGKLISYCHLPALCYYPKMIGFALDKEQLATLLKMVYVANTIANSPYEGMPGRKDFQEMEEYVFLRAKDTFPLAVFKHKVGDENHHHPSFVFENDPDINSMMDQYEEFATKFVLAEKFAEREIEEEFGVHAKDKMSADQYESLILEKAPRYEEIIKKHGYKALTIDKKYL